MEQDERETAMLHEINSLRTVVRSLNGDNQRKTEILFQVIQFARDHVKHDFTDWKDADDWLFSNFDLTKEELEEIYEGRGEMVYIGSCVLHEKNKE